MERRGGRGYGGGGRQTFLMEYLQYFHDCISMIVSQFGVICSVNSLLCHVCFGHKCIHTVKCNAIQKKIMFFLFFGRKLPNWKKKFMTTFSYNKVLKCSWDWIEYAMNMAICL